ncbi:MAG: glycosyltransferase family 2 protein [Planctomycetota bacterium]
MPSSSDRPRQRLSVVLPAYNEQDVLPMALERFLGVGPRLAAMGLDLELVFVNDGSRDKTAGILDEAAEKDSRVKAVHLTRNFGHQAAISAGLRVATGDAVAIMDCDLQDPPEILPEFVDKWREGFQVVYAVRRKRKENAFKRTAYWVFYRLMAFVSEMDIPLDSGDFCLMDRSAVDLMNGLPECERFVRGLRTWVGLKQTGLEYERDARAAGVPQYTLKKLIKLAADGLVSFSGVPLKMVTRVGVACGVLSLAFTLWAVLDGLFDITGADAGWPSLAAIVTFIGSVQLLSLGIIGEYLSRIFVEVKGRPTYLIARIASSDSDSTPQPLNGHRPRTADRVETSQPAEVASA